MTRIVRDQLIFDPLNPPKGEDTSRQLTERPEGAVFYKLKVSNSLTQLLG